MDRVASIKYYSCKSKFEETFRELNEKFERINSCPNCLDINHVEKIKCEACRCWRLDSEYKKDQFHRRNKTCIILSFARRLTHESELKPTPFLVFSKNRFFLNWFFSVFKKSVFDCSDFWGLLFGDSTDSKHVP